MSNNGSIGSNTTNTTDDYIYEFELPDIFNIYCGFAIFITVAGTLLNLWFLVAILSSQDTRSRLRNKIICNSLLLHLVDSVIILPLDVWRILNMYFMDCIFYAVKRHLTIIQDFIGNWLLVMLLGVFIAQIQDFNPRIKLSQRTVTLGTVGILVLPWVASLVLVPIIVHEYHKRSIYRQYCVLPTRDAIAVFKSVDTATPIFLFILLLLIALVLIYRRLNRVQSSRSIQEDLISGIPEIDSPIVYIVATAVCIFCDLFQLIFAFNVSAFMTNGYETWVTMHGVSIIMSNSRVILMPLPWLLLPDIRQRIRTWRPWYRPAPGIDLAMLYKKEEN